MSQAFYQQTHFYGASAFRLSHQKLQSVIPLWNEAPRNPQPLSGSACLTVPDFPGSLAASPYAALITRTPPDLGSSLAIFALLPTQHSPRLSLLKLEHHQPDTLLPAPSAMLSFLCVTGASPPTLMSPCPLRLGPQGLDGWPAGFVTSSALLPTSVQPHPRAICWPPLPETANPQPRHLPYPSCKAPSHLLSICSPLGGSVYLMGRGYPGNLTEGVLCLNLGGGHIGHPRGGPH